jgi:thiamine kinase-like enzyme
MKIDRPQLEEVVISIAKYLYKAEPKITKYSTRDSSVWGLEFDDGKTDRVIKLDINRPTSLMREKQIIQVLKAEGFEVPEIEYTQEDVPSVWIPFIIMPKIANNTTLRKAYDTQTRSMLEYCAKTGEFLARLHQLPITKMSINPSFSLSAEGFGENLTASEIDLKQLNMSLNYLRNSAESLLHKNKIVKSLKQLKQIVEQNDRQDVTHRDFVPSQILVNNREFFVIDWEFAAAGRSFRDLGDFIAALRRFTKEDLYIRAFLNSYNSFRTLSSAEIAEVGLWEVFSMIRRSRLNTVGNKEQVARRLFQLAGEETFASQFRAS